MNEDESVNFIENEQTRAAFRSLHQSISLAQRRYASARGAGFLVFSFSSLSLSCMRRLAKAAKIKAVARALPRARRFSSACRSHKVTRAERGWSLNGLLFRIGKFIGRRKAKGGKRRREKSSRSAGVCGLSRARSDIFKYRDLHSTRFRAINRS